MLTYLQGRLWNSELQLQCCGNIHVRRCHKPLCSLIYSISLGLLAPSLNFSMRPASTSISTLFFQALRPSRQPLPLRKLPLDPTPSSWATTTLSTTQRARRARPPPSTSGPTRRKATPKRLLSPPRPPASPPRITPRPISIGSTCRLFQVMVNLPHMSSGFSLSADNLPHRYVSFHSYVCILTWRCLQVQSRLCINHCAVCHDLLSAFDTLSP